jgi:hypothetical protein
MRIEVESYSGRKADERPVRFRAADREYEVLDVLDQWYGPEETWFKVRAEDGVYIIKHDPARDEWTLSSYRADNG